jgi:hypothetical protein
LPNSSHYLYTSSTEILYGNLQIATILYAGAILEIYLNMYLNPLDLPSIFVDLRNKPNGEKEVRAKKSRTSELS